MSPVISVIIVAALAVFTSITAPLYLSHRTEKMHRDDLLEQYRREDLVAKRASAVAEALLAQQQQTARDLAAAHADANCRTDEVARTAARTNASVNGKLDIIHQLVNSSMSAAMQSELDALETSLVMMKEVIDLKRTAGHEPTEEAIAAVQAAEAKIREARANIDDRLKQSELIEQQKEEREREREREP
jgi:hypothetical protein